MALLVTDRAQLPRRLAFMRTAHGRVWFRWCGDPLEPDWFVTRADLDALLDWIPEADHDEVLSAGCAGRRRLPEDAMALTEAMRDAIVRRIREGVPSIEIATTLRVALSAVRRERAAFLDATGAMPPCRCGLAGGHRGWCIGSKQTPGGGQTAPASKASSATRAVAVAKPKAPATRTLAPPPRRPPPAFLVEGCEPRRPDRRAPRAAGVARG